MTREEYCRRPGRSSKWIRREKRVAIYIRDGFRCMYCGEDLRDAKPHQMGLDHLEPQNECKRRGNKTRSGKSMHHESNLVTACATCNCSRQDMPLHRFAAPGAIKRIRRNVRRKLNMDLARAMVRGEVDWADC